MSLPKLSSSESVGVSAGRPSPRATLRARLCAGALRALLLLPVAASLTATGCASMRPIPGTKIADTPTNRELIQRCEEYRLAMEQRDAGKLLSLAHPQYFEDSGTPTGADDYGYPGLKRVLEQRLSSVRWMRYLIKYRDIHIEGNRAMVDIKYDLNFQLMTEIGEKWERRQNDKRLELIRDDNHWMFVSGY